MRRGGGVPDGRAATAHLTVGRVRRHRPPAWVVDERTGQPGPESDREVDVAAGIVRALPCTRAAVEVGENRAGLVDTRCRARRDRCTRSSSGSRWATVAGWRHDSACQAAVSPISRPVPGRATDAHLSGPSIAGWLLVPDRAPLDLSAARSRMRRGRQPCRAPAAADHFGRSGCPTTPPCPRSLHRHRRRCGGRRQALDAGRPGCLKTARSSTWGAQPDRAGHRASAVCAPATRPSPASCSGRGRVSPPRSPRGRQSSMQSATPGPRRGDRPTSSCHRRHRRCPAPAGGAVRADRDISSPWAGDRGGPELESDGSTSPR